MGLHRVLGFRGLGFSIGEFRACFMGLNREIGFSGLGVKSFGSRVSLDCLVGQ